MKRIQAIVALLLFAGCCDCAPHPMAADYARQEKYVEDEICDGIRELADEKAICVQPLRARITNEPLEFYYTLCVMSPSHRLEFYAADKDTIIFTNGRIRFTENGKLIELTGQYTIKILSNCTTGTKAEVIAH